VVEGIVRLSTDTNQTTPMNAATKVTVIKEDLREGRQTRLLGQTLYMWDDRPQMHYNQSKVLVSKQPDGACRFAISPECLKLA
jgi:hypothetical protein